MLIVAHAVPAGSQTSTGHAATSARITLVGIGTLAWGAPPTRGTGP